MSAAELPPAVQADELRWDLPGVCEVLCYRRGGEGRPLLLLHSINAAPSAFEVSPFFDSAELDLHRPLYAPDLPGFGRSQRDDRAYKPEFFARALLAIVEKILEDSGSDAVDVLALSTTAEFAARAALAMPERFASLVLVSPTGLSRRRDRPSSAGPKVHRFFRLRGVGSTLYRLLRSRRSIRFFLDKAFTDGAPEAMIDYACATTRVPGASFAPFYFLSGQMFCHDAVGELYLPLTQPVLVLYDTDPNISFNFLDVVLDKAANWTATRIAGTRGLPHFEKPAETRVALEAFWAEAA
ncbi:MAG: alpha/beta fold hydrolase [Halieaceae bacterium]|nr:alpha/beta fold hydrolase [Halieaceae bacterium]